MVTVSTEKHYSNPGDEVGAARACVPSTAKLVDGVSGGGGQVGGGSGGHSPVGGRGGNDESRIPVLNASLLSPKTRSATARHDDKAAMVTYRLHVDLSHGPGHDGTSLDLASPGGSYGGVLRERGTAATFSTAV